MLLVNIFLLKENATRHKSILAIYTNYVDNIKQPLLWAKAMFTEDATFRIACFPLATGHEQIAASAQNVYNMTASLTHSTSRCYSITDDIFVTEGTVSYVAATGKVLQPIPISSFFFLLPGTNMIKDYRAYMDPSALLVANGLQITSDKEGNMLVVAATKSIEETPNNI